MHIMKKNRADRREILQVGEGTFLHREDFEVLTFKRRLNEGRKWVMRKSGIWKKSQQEEQAEMF